jgi:hypothetical protein
LGRTVNYISCVFIGYKNVFGPIAVLVTNRFGRPNKILVAFGDWATVHFRHWNHFFILDWNKWCHSSLFTLGSARAALVVALVYSFPDVFNVIMALISTYTNQPFIVPIWWTSIVSYDHPSQWRQGCQKGYNK